MALLKSTLRGLVQDVCGRTDKDTVIDNALDFAVTVIKRKHVFADFITSHSEDVSTYYMALPSDYKYPVIVLAGTGVNAREVTIKSYSWLRRKYPDLDQYSGEIMYCAEMGSNMYFSPNPSSSTTIELVYGKAVEFSGGSLSGMDELKDLLVDYALSYTYNAINMYDVGAMWEQKFWKGLQEAIDDDKKKNIFWQAEEFDPGKFDKRDYFKTPDSLPVD